MRSMQYGTAAKMPGTSGSPCSVSLIDLGWPGRLMIRHPFLTTATCEAVGLADDCWELRTLRKFRDDWLADQQGGMDDIKAYYAKAPAIAERLKQDPQALLRLYWTRIVPSAVAAQVGANRLACAIYSKGMRELAAG